MQLVKLAEGLAREHLSEVLPRRWAHVQSVAAEAARIAEAFGEDRELVVAAAWVHDIGYAPELATLRFHPVDGARFLAEQGASDRLCALIAHHSCAATEAELRGVAGELVGFADEASPVRDALWYCDMVTGPDGQRLAAADRLAEIQERYGPGSVVSRFVDLARPELLAAVNRTRERIAAAGLRQST